VANEDFIPSLLLYRVVVRDLFSSWLVNREVVNDEGKSYNICALKAVERHAQEDVDALMYSGELAQG
jgi:hypothetical protein